MLPHSSFKLLKNVCERLWTEPLIIMISLGIVSKIHIIIRNKFFFLFIGREPTT